MAIAKKKKAALTQRTKKTSLRKRPAKKRIPKKRVLSAKPPLAALPKTRFQLSRLAIGLVLLALAYFALKQHFGSKSSTNERFARQADGSVSWESRATVKSKRYAPGAVAGTTSRNVLGSRYRVERHTLDATQILSADKKYLLSVQRIQDVCTRKPPNGQSEIQFANLEFWSSSYREPLWSVELQVELTCQPWVLTNGSIWLLGISPNLEPEGTLKLIRLGRGGSIAQELSLSRLIHAGLDTPDYHGVAHSPNGRYIAVSFLRSGDVLKPVKMKRPTFFFDLTSARMWTDGKYHPLESISDDGKVRFLGRKKEMDIANKLVTHGMALSE